MLFKYLNTRSSSELTQEYNRGLSAQCMKYIQLLKNISADKQGNYLYCPYGLGMVLNILLDAADGETKDELLKCLAESGLEQKELCENDDILKIANLLLLKNEDVVIKETYRKEMAEKYKAKMICYDEQEAPQVYETLNDFVKQATDNMLENPLTASDLKQAAFTIINMLYFNAQWEGLMAPIPEYQFYPEPGKLITVPGMSDNKSTYVYNETVEGFKKKYKGGRYAFYGLMPKGSDSNTIVDELLAMDLTNELMADNIIELSITMPKFSISTEMDFKPLLKILGAKKIFKKGDFSTALAYTQPLFIESIKQNCKLDVDEKGTVGAAVTKVESYTLSMPKKKHLDFNKPFLFIINDEKTQQPLFVGIVKKPM